jgi:RNA polymerase sigma-70 factor (ECF subfamily)
MSGMAVGRPADSEALLAAYDDALPHVYGYLLSRCGQSALAEDLTAETFLAAVDAVRDDDKDPPLNRSWLLGIARHKLADHWRREARDRARVRAVTETARDDTDDLWEARLDRVVAVDTLARLAPQHRLVLTLRYCDDLPVPDVADLIGRTLHATEAPAGPGPRRLPPGLSTRDDRGRGGPPWLTRCTVWRRRSSRCGRPRHSPPGFGTGWSAFSHCQKELP